jgi:hypothetical protein
MKVCDAAARQPDSKFEKLDLKTENLGRNSVTGTPGFIVGQSVPPFFVFSELH